MADDYYKNLAAKYGTKYNIPSNLLYEQWRQESNFNPQAKSHAGAMGLSQLMPGTAAQLGVKDPWDVEQNADGGARYLRQMHDMFGDWGVALQAYNAGPGNARKHKGNVPFKETQAYYKNILTKAGMLGQPGPQVASAAPAAPQSGEIESAGDSPNFLEKLLSALGGGRSNGQEGGGANVFDFLGTLFKG